jgi:dTDP-4-dehydrorhamnose reductase
MKKRIIILGAFGKVGEDIFNFLRLNTDWEVYGFARYKENLKPFWTRQHCDYDILNFKELKNHLISLSPDYIINAAAYTNVDGCEEFKSDCWKLNSDLVKLLASVCAITGSHLIHFSTDYIFDGRMGPYSEIAQPNPINFYGKSKLSAENSIKLLDIKYTIIRTNFLFGLSKSGKKTFVDFAIDNLSNGNPINVVDSLYSNPIITSDISEGIWRIINNNYLGVINFAGNDWISRFVIAKIIAEIGNYNFNLINKVNLNEVEFLANRPEKAGLINFKAKNKLGMNFMPIHKSIEHYFKMINFSKITSSN